MQIFNSGYFWFIEGILFVVVILAVRAMLEDRGIKAALWKWALFVFWILLGGFTIAYVGTSYGEGEPVAAVKGGLLFGLITVISGVGAWRLLFSGPKTGGGEAELGA
jgi:hypothetical protein